VNSNRAEPAAVASGFIPTAGEHVVFAVGGFDDLAVPVAVVLDCGVFQPVLGIAREHIGRTPGVTNQLAVRRSGEKIVDERLRLRLGACVRRAGLLSEDWGWQQRQQRSEKANRQEVLGKAELISGGDQHGITVAAAGWDVNNQPELD
jgi:hypothetical protein